MAVETIWKFPLDMTPAQVLRLPIFARMLSVQVQYATPTIWASVSKELAQHEANMVDVPVYMVGTGDSVPDNTTFLGTVQLAEGRLVLHVFHGAHFSKVENG